MATSDGSHGRRVSSALLVALCALTCSLGVVKLLLQRERPPAYALQMQQTYEGFVAIDGYAQRAERAREALLGNDPGWEMLRRDLRENLHPTSFLVPLAVGALALTGVGIPLAFAALSLGAALGAALIAGRIARRLSPGSGPGLETLAAVLVVSHFLVLRTAAQLYMDPFCALWGAATTLVLLQWRARPRAGTALALVALLSSGLWVKISLLPLLAAPTLVQLVDGGERAPRRILGSALLFGAAPLAGWFLSLWAVGSPGLARVDFVSLTSLLNFTGGWRYLDVFALEMALLFQAFPLVLFLPRVPGEERQAVRAVLVVFLLVLLSTWSFRLLPIPRIYLPIPPLLAALTAPRLLAALEARWARWLLGGHLVANYAAGVLALVLSLG